MSRLPTPQQIKHVVADNGQRPAHGKIPKDRCISIPVSAATRKRLEERAQAEDVSIAHVARRCIERQLTSDERQ